jgi:4-carboxymuconolactone decarboxylase
MSHRTDSLAGACRWPSPPPWTGAQRELFDRMMTTIVPWADENGFQAITADGRLIGPLNAGYSTRRSGHNSFSCNSPSNNTPH